MKFGLLVGAAFPDTETMPSPQVSDFALRMAETAYRSGFDALGLAHRPIPGRQVQFMHPLILASYLLSRYPTMAVATTVLLLPYYHPVDLAEQIATLRQVADGRLVLGVGQGYRRDEADVFGLGRGERGRRLAEGIAAIRACLSDAEVSFHGEFWEFKDVTIGVRPSDGQAPPILVAADTLRTIDLIPERGGDHWLSSARHSISFLREALPIYRASIERSGRRFQGIAMTRDICVGRTREEAEALVKESFTRYLHLQHRWGQPGEAYDVEFDQLKRERFISGTSEGAAEEIIELHREFASDFIVFRTYTPGMTTERAIESIQQVGEEVLPIVRREVGTTSMILTR